MPASAPLCSRVLGGLCSGTEDAQYQPCWGVDVGTDRWMDTGRWWPRAATSHPLLRQAHRAGGDSFQPGQFLKIPCLPPLWCGESGWPRAVPGKQHQHALPRRRGWVYGWHPAGGDGHSRAGATLGAGAVGPSTAPGVPPAGLELTPRCSPSRRPSLLLASPRPRLWGPNHQQPSHSRAAWHHVLFGGQRLCQQPGAGRRLLALRRQ